MKKRILSILLIAILVFHIAGHHLQCRRKVYNRVPLA